MKKTSWILGAVAFLVFTAALMAQQQSAQASGSHLGTWQLFATKYGEAKNFSDYPKENRRLKMITATHFSWVDYSLENKRVNSTAGGPYTLRDNAYIETIEFVGEGMETYIGKKQEFTIRIDGDKLFQSGRLSDGLKIEEVWQRVK